MARYLRKPNVRSARVKFPWEKAVIEEKDFQGTMGGEDDCGCRLSDEYLGIVPLHTAIGSIDNWPEDCLDPDERAYGSPSEYRGKRWVPFEEWAVGIVPDDDWDDDLITDYTAKELGPNAIRRAARELLLTVGCDPDRFDEPEKARLMMLAAKVYVEKSLTRDRDIFGLDGLIALYHQTADNDGTAFLHSFVPALCRRIREWCGCVPKISVQAERFLRYNAKAEEVYEDEPDWIRLGRAIYGEVEFADLLRRTPAISKRLRAERLAATA